MVTIPAASDNSRPVWLVSGGPQWRSFTRFWQHYDIGHDHTSLIHEMQRGDRIALRTDVFDETRLENAQGGSVASVGIWATGIVERTDGHFVYVDWNLGQLEYRRLRDCRIDRIVDRFAADQCIWRMDSRNATQQDFIREVFGEDHFGDEVHSIISDVRAQPYHTSYDPSVDYRITNILADGCFLNEATLESMLHRLRTKRNIILQGPPGAGKTWLSKRLAYALIGHKDDTKVRQVQFHPNLSYEDFVRGWRPDGEGGLVLADGPFLKLCEVAGKDTDSKYVMVIEEINRGNPASIFGELLTLLESDKRSPSEALALAYPHDDNERFHIPPNVYVIGTMNLADRSLALVDFALRRRFAFFDLEPQLNAAWRKWVQEKCGIPADFLANIEARISALNAQIATDHNLGKQFRIGHSHVTPPPDTPIDDPQQWFTEIVETEITPLLREYWFDRPDRAEEESQKLLSGL